MPQLSAMVQGVTKAYFAKIGKLDISADYWQEPPDEWQSITT